MKAPWIAAPPSTSSDWIARAPASSAPARRARAPTRPRAPRVQHAASAARVVEHVAAPRAGSAPRAPPAPRRSGCGGAAAPSARQPHRQLRIVGAHRPRADQHRVVRGAQLVRRRARLRAGDPDRRRAARRRAVGDEAVQRRRRLQRHQRPPLAHPDREGADRARGTRPPGSRRRRGCRRAAAARRRARRRAGWDRGSRRPRARRRAASSASVHGPVRPVWSHGSSVTYSVAPRARGPPSARAARHLGVRLAGAAVEPLGQRSARRARPPRRPPGSAASCRARARPAPARAA